MRSTSPKTRLPHAAQRIHEVESALADSLMEGERVRVSYPVGTGSLLGAAATGALPVVVWLALPERTGGTTWHLWLLSLLLLAALTLPVALVADRYVLRKREMVLTDRRMLLCRVGWFDYFPFRGHALSIEAIEADVPRAGLQLFWKNKDQPVFVDRDGRRIALRIPTFYRAPARAIEGWAQEAGRAPFDSSLPQPPA
jgi:hypothetical protein